jgi:hypothetical protein
VLRTGGPSSGHVQVVSFKSYVQMVLAAEWPANWAVPALQTGAVVTKQYAWYYAMHYRGGTAHGTCYDVADDSSDQVYQPETRHPSAGQLAAIEATWTESLVKYGSFFATGYRPGINYLHCGKDADGSHLFQHSSLDCAAEGMTADEMLHVYLDPGLAILRPAARPAAIFFLPAAQSQVTVGTSAPIAWVEDLAVGTTIAARSTTLTMSLPKNGWCTSDRWLPASPPWQSSDASVQTVSGLRPGYCYRVLVQLTDSAGVTTRAFSGPMLVDPAAPSAIFDNPPPNAVTLIADPGATVQWEEAPAPGTQIASRSLITQWAAQPELGSCTGAQWSTLRATSTSSPYQATDLLKMYCYRYALVLTDSAGHSSTTISGDLMTPAE